VDEKPAACAPVWMGAMSRGARGGWRRPNVENPRKFI